ncbi:MAG TPA: ABC transporter permease [Cyclobacteriaceae bacterium]|jgi:putative ABC transport system permease protein
MVKNYLKIAFRNIANQKLYSFINIMGLTIGIAGSIFILFYVVDELSYDKFHTDAKRIYRVGLQGKIAGQEINVIYTCPPLANAMANEFPEVESAVRLGQNLEILFRYEDMIFYESDVLDADSNFFSFFSFKLLKGNPETCLAEPNSLVITEDMAQKYFGNEDPIGKILVIGNQNTSYKVTGVSENPPHNSHFTYKALLTTVSQDQFRDDIWLNNGIHTYYKLRPDATNENMPDKFEDLVIKYVGPEVQQFMGISLDQFKSSGSEYGYYSQRLLDIHLKSNQEGELGVNGNITYVYIFSAIGIFILVIACINFMNLSTARSAGRAKEVGLRKTLGSLRSNLIGQFLTEAVLYTIISTALGIITVYLLLPLFNLIAGKEHTIATLLNPAIMGSLATIVLVTGLLAGSYPAFYLTSFKVTEVLKGKLKSGMKSSGVRSVLVIFQFAISIILIICTTLVYQQLNFVRHKNLGFDKEKVIVIQNTAPLGNNREPFKNSLLSFAEIESASFSTHVIPGTTNTTVFRSQGEDIDHIMSVYSADYDHLETFGFELKEGRFFSSDFPADSTSIVLNEAAVAEFGLEDPIGSEIFYSPQNQTFKVIGVLKDFNYESLRNEVGPHALFLTHADNRLAIKYSGEAASTVKLIKSKWEELAPNEPFEYYFLDDKFNALFKSEQQLGELFTIFTGLAIFIACLGLFGLASFMAERRTKEIGIRKALGASTPALIQLLSTEFTKLVIISFVISILPAWYFMSSWLDNFAFRIELSPLVFVLAGFGALLLAWITVGYQSIKVAGSNPVNSLRYE